MEAAGIVNQISFSLPKGSSVRPRQEGRDSVGRMDDARGSRAVWREEYYDETRESDDDCERWRSGGRIIYEAQNGTTTLPLLCIAPRQICCFKKSPLAQSVLPSRGSLSIHLPTYCLSPRMCASSRTTMARIIGYQQHSLPPSLSPPLCSLDSSRAHYYDRQGPSPSLPSSHSLTS